MRGYGQVVRVEGIGVGVWSLVYGDLQGHAKPRAVPGVWVLGSGFLRHVGLGFRVEGLWNRRCGFGNRVTGKFGALVFRVGFGNRVKGIFGALVSGFWVRVLALGFRVYISEIGLKVRRDKDQTLSTPAGAD